MRVVIATSFGPEFEGSCVAFGLLPVPLDPEAVEEIEEWVGSNPKEEMTVDLETEEIRLAGREAVSFSIHPRLRNKLLFGLSELEEMLEHRAQTIAFRRADRTRRPWLYAGQEQMKGSEPPGLSDEEAGVSEPGE